MTSPLEKYDRYFTNVDALYFYNGVLDPETLQKSLDRTIEEIPIFSSVIKKNNETLYLEHIRPSNVQITVKSVDDKLYDNYKPDKNGILSSVEGMELSKQYESVDKTPTLQPVFDKPITKISLLLTKESRKSIVCVSISHCLVDAHTLVYFMKKFSMGEEFKDFEKFDCSRAHLKPRKREDMKGISDPKILSRLHNFHRIDYTVPKEEDGLRFIYGKPFVRKVIHFSKQKLHELKKLVSKENKDGLKFSSHDCMTAQMWRLYSALTLMKYDSDICTPLKLVVNVRNRVKGISTNFMGNGVIIVNSNLNREEILKEMEYSDLVLRIRELVNSVDNDTFVTAMDLFNLKEDKLYFSRKTECIVDDCRLVDAEKPSNFGSENEDLVCERVVFYPPSAPFAMPGLFFVHLADDGGLLIKCMFETEEYEVLKGLDLANPECIEKIVGRIRD